MIIAFCKHCGSTDLVIDADNQFWCRDCLNSIQLYEMGFASIPEDQRIRRITSSQFTGECYGRTADQPS